MNYLNPLPVAPQHQRPSLQLFVWGATDFGQCGLGAETRGEISKPKRSTWAESKMGEGAFGGAGAGLESIASGGMHSLFVDETGKVWSCGVNDEAALGRITQGITDPENPGSFLDADDLTSFPHPIATLVDENFRTVKVTAGDNHSTALSDQGELRVWGSFRANEGSLGFAKELKHQFTPMPILNIASRANGQEKVADMASGDNHIVVLTTHGNIYTWGAGEEGQLGRKILERRKINGTVPERALLGPRSRKAVVVGSGSYHSFAVDEDGDVWGWGLNTRGQTGTGYSGPQDDQVITPKKVIGLDRQALHGHTVVKIKGGNHHTLFLTSDGRVFSCGRCDNSQLGLPDDSAALQDQQHQDFVAHPVEVVFPENDDPIVAVSAGPQYSMAVSHDGALYSWGQGMQGELGADEEEIKAPRMIVRRTGNAWQAVAVSCGGQHVLGLFRKRS